MDRFYDIEIDGISMTTLGFLATGEMKPALSGNIYEEYDVLREDGNLIIDTGRKKDISRQVTFTYIGEMYEFDEQYQKLKKILLEGKTIVFSVTTDRYYKIKKTELSDSSQFSRGSGRLQATFTLNPYAYYFKGLCKEYSPSLLVNIYDPCWPDYLIIPEESATAGTLTVNGYQIPFSITGPTLGIYTADRMTVGGSIKGYFDALKLKRGGNTFAVSADFQLVVMPNWRSAA